MASSSFSDAPNPDVVDSESKSVTIVINDNGEINYDEKTLQSIIGKFFDGEKYPYSNFIFMWYINMYLYLNCANKESSNELFIFARNKLTL